MKKIAHIIPTLEVGGAEIATIEIAKIAKKNLSYKIFPIKYVSKELINQSIYQDNICYPKRILFSYHIGLFFNILKYNPDIIICSLWKSYLIPYLVSKCIKSKIIFFLHSSKFFNIFDRIISSFAFKTADLVLVDSISSKNFFERKENKKIKKCFPFYLILREVNFNPSSYKNKNFIFIGRISPIKNIELSIDIFKAAFEIDPSIYFHIYGPISDEIYYNNLKRKIKSFNLENNIIFKGSLKYSDIPNTMENYKFYLQTSDVEGMAISVVEAMKSGLIPIVTNVGEIQYYCIDNYNALIVDEHIYTKLHILMSDINNSRYMSLYASQSFSGYNTVEESLKELIDNVTK